MVAQVMAAFERSLNVMNPYSNIFCETNIFLVVYILPLLTAISWTHFAVGCNLPRDEFIVLPAIPDVLNIVVLVFLSSSHPAACTCEGTLLFSPSPTTSHSPALSLAALLFLSNLPIVGLYVVPGALDLSSMRLGNCSSGPGLALFIRRCCRGGDGDAQRSIVGNSGSRSTTPLTPQRPTALLRWSMVWDTFSAELVGRLDMGCSIPAARGACLVLFKDPVGLGCLTCSGARAPLPIDGSGLSAAWSQGLWARCWPNGHLALKAMNDVDLNKAMLCGLQSTPSSTVKTPC